MAITEATYSMDGGVVVKMHSLRNTKIKCNECGFFQTPNEARDHTAQTGHPTYINEIRTASFKLQESEAQPW